MKKLISLISAFAVAAFGAVPVISAGEDGGYSFEYSVNDSGTAVITGGTGSGSVLNIPSQIDGLTVTEIGEQAFSGLGSLSTVILPDSITKIGDLLSPSARTSKRSLLTAAIRIFHLSAEVFSRAASSWYMQAEAAQFSQITCVRYTRELSAEKADLPR